jgi:hypothetical protein
MDFIERILHVSPDGGSGATEFLYVIAIGAVGLTLLFRLFIRARGV